MGNKLLIAGCLTGIVGAAGLSLKWASESPGVEAQATAVRCVRYAAQDAGQYDNFRVKIIEGIRASCQVQIEEFHKMLCLFKPETQPSAVNKLTGVCRKVFMNETVAQDCRSAVREAVEDQMGVCPDI